MESEVIGGIKTIFLVKWDSKMVLASLRGTGDESNWVCTAVPMESLFVFLFSSISAGRGVCCCVLPVLLLEQLPTVFRLGAAHLKCPRPVFAPEEHISSFSVVLLSLKTQHSRRQKGCSANSLLFKQCLQSQRP